jgi:aminopeptidase YwaD
MDKSCDEYAREAIGLCAGIIDRHGSRVSGSEGCRGARAELAAALGEHCTSSWREALRISPDSLFAIGKIFAIGYLAGFAAIAIGGKLAYAIGLGVMVLGIAYFVTQFILYLDVFDGLFAKVDGENVTGVVQARGVARRHVILVAHHDSAPIYPFYEKLPSLFPFRLLLAIAFYLGCVVALILGLASTPAAAAPATKLTLFLGLAFALPMFGYISNRGSPGAGDNLIGCAICLKVAEAVASSGGLSSTRLTVLLTDGEEVGQKGAKSYIGKNRELLAGLDTTVINIDSIFEIGRAHV